jgi:CBS domain-containing protein
VLLAGLVGKGTEYVTQKQTMLDAFKAIVDKKISAVAVLDDQQRIIGNISVRDLRSVLKEKPNLKLQMTIADFLAETKAPPAISVGSDASVRFAVSKLTSSSIHRIYVVDEHGYPQGVISITDIFKYLLRAGFEVEPSFQEQGKSPANSPREPESPRVIPPAPPSPKDHHISLLDDAFQIMFPEFKSEDELVFVLGNTPAEDVVKTLKEKEVSCVPVLDPVKKIDNHPRVQGLVDIADIATYVFGLRRSSAHKGEKMTYADLHEKKLKGATAKDLINHSGINQAAILGVQTRMMDVFAALIIPRVHRVPVMSTSDEREISRSGVHTKKHAVGKFVTQSQVLRFIATHLNEFGPILEKTVVAARVGVFKPKFIKSSSTVYEGFKTLIREKVSGAPVIDDNYKVIGSLSTTDLRLVVFSNPNLNINKPLSEFFEDIQEDQTYSKPRRVVTCSYADTVHSVITKLHSNQVHRLFIVDERGLLIGVVSLSDVLKYILRSGSHY